MDRYLGASGFAAVLALSGAAALLLFPAERRFREGECRNSYFQGLLASIYWLKKASCLTWQRNHRNLQMNHDKDDKDYRKNNLCHAHSEKQDSDQTINI